MSTKITSPVKGYSERTVFGPTALQFNDGVAESDEPLSEGLKAYLEGRGYTVETTVEHDGPFNPAKHSVADVRAYLDGLDSSDPDAHDAEVRRIFEAETAGKNRSTLLESIAGTPADPPAGTPPTGDQGDGNQGDSGQQKGGDDQ
ncbi:hypothetical protein [Promicromonospora iranensis]|uniref:Internal scaffolding protein n=1 Tax=Promicromonospora iranensis TaxID=1105144 RepID=A0ABU2CV45_9MICO|nr:hypothetical protein [Promicromonospora iranensis]MDR7385215.1 hypothetical protein [Promicromonospora iranensis]